MTYGMDAENYRRIRALHIWNLSRLRRGIKIDHKYSFGIMSILKDAQRSAAQFRKENIRVVRS